MQVIENGTERAVDLAQTAQTIADEMIATLSLPNYGLVMGLEW